MSDKKLPSAGAAEGQLETLADSYVKSTLGYDEYYENGFAQNSYKDMREAFRSGWRARDAEVAQLQSRVEKLREALI